MKDHWSVDKICDFENELIYPDKNSVITFFLQLLKINEEISFVLLRKLPAIRDVSTKSVPYYIPGNEVESSQNASRNIQNSFVVKCLKEWISDD